MTSTPSGSTLPVLALPHPLVLLPTGRITVPIPKTVGEALLARVRESDEQPLVAAVPLTAPEAALYQWGVASRILRLIKPTTNNQRQFYLLTLNGITRVRIVDSSPDKPAVLNIGLMHKKVEYANGVGTASPETVVKFKAAALKLLDLLTKDTTQQTKKDAYNKAMATVEEASPARAPWVADVIVSSINGEYADKLGEQPRHLLPRHPANRLARFPWIVAQCNGASA